MIAQLLNREFLLTMAEATQAEAERAVQSRAPGHRRRGAPSPVDDLETTELRELAQAFDEIGERREQLEADAHGELGDGDAPRPLEDFAFIPRDPLLSIVQSALDAYFEEREPQTIVERPLRDDRRGGPDPVVTDRQLSTVALNRTRGGRRLWGKFEVGRPRLKLLVSDPGWILSAVAMGYRALKGKAHFVESPARVPIADTARLLLVGDWGSGLPRAQKVADRMREELARFDGEQHVIHLGDVYYSGTKREYEQRFLNYWPVPAGSDIGSFTLNGNHDMYTGGHAYYGTCLADPRFHRQRGCSYFVLENASWQILGLDSAYDDEGLAGPQAGWAKDLVDRRGPERKTCLLSHHQLFSAHEAGAAEMADKLGPVLEHGVDAWFWGHEHRCISYSGDDAHGGRVGFSSCIGHGGVPEYLHMKEGETRPAPWVYEYLKNYGTALEPWETFGFVVAELRGADMALRYIDEDGNEHHTVPSIRAGA